MRDEKLHTVWREAHLEVKSVKTRRSRTAFGSCDVEKVHAVVARSTFGSQKCQKLRVLSHFLMIRWRLQHLQEIQQLQQLQQSQQLQQLQH